MKIFFNFWLTKFFHSIKHTKFSTVYRVFQLLKNAGFHSTRPAKASTSENDLWQKYCTFQSTRPTKASTLIAANTYRDKTISIHETHKGLDGVVKVNTMLDNDFNPRDPQRPRLYGQKTDLGWFDISIHETHKGLDAYRVRQDKPAM